jgi:hypothetical protein
MLKLDDTHPMNQGLNKHLRERHGGQEAISTPDTHPDPYLRAGSHPDIVGWIWDTLGSALPADCRAMVYGTPALVHPSIGVVLALAYGTAYLIRIPNDFVKDAKKSGYTTERTWSDGTRTDIQELLGPGWLFGSWEKEETSWLLTSYINLQDAT